jgi:glutaminyl-tRNA synthetase
MITVSNHPANPDCGTREVPMTREIYIDSDDFAEVPPPKFFRLKPDGEVRLMGGYIIKCGQIEKNEDGSIKCIHATADLETGNGMPADGRKIKGTIHWLSAKYAKPASLMLYDRLFNIENTADVPEGQTYLDFLNPQSLTKICGAMVEPCLDSAAPGERFQFVRVGYFCKDTKNENTFNRVVGLKDSFPAKK